MIPCDFLYHQRWLKKLLLLYCSFCSFKDLSKSLDLLRHPAPHVLALADASSKLQQELTAVAGQGLPRVALPSDRRNCMVSSCIQNLTVWDFFPNPRANF